MDHFHNAILNVSYIMSHDLRDFAYNTHTLPIPQYDFCLSLVIFFLFSTSGPNSKYFSFEKILEV